jgi:uncharacterized protein
MPTPITVTIGTLQLAGQLDDSPTARALIALLPLSIRMSRWGDEYYGALPKKLGIGQAADAREEMAVGELAYWPPGNALCIFFGPTPVSMANEPRAASPVNPVGMITGDSTTLRKLGERVDLTVSTPERC